MKIRRTSLLLLLNILCGAAFAQSINNTLAYKNINCNSYFRLNYENDFFGFTDEYYTQGINVELTDPVLDRFVLNNALVKLHKGHTRYGIGIEHNGYTPSSISHDDILRNDRPFAATLFLKTYSISIDSLKRQRLSSTISTGIIGPIAGGKEMQTSIHKALNNITPHGWNNQIENDIVLNYEINLEQELVGWRNIFSLSANGTARAGTLSDKAGAGITVMAGYFDSPFSNHTSRKNDFRIYAYDHAQANLVGYDATMQGGVFNVNSPYTIKSVDISRGVLENRFGFVVTYQRFYLEYFQSLYGCEFVQGRIHNFGGIQLAFGL